MTRARARGALPEGPREVRLRGWTISPPGPAGGPWRISAGGVQVGTAPTLEEARRIVTEDLGPA